MALSVARVVPRLHNVGMNSENRVIEIGGEDCLPEYPRAYFEAAQRLLSAPDGELILIALPIIYLQRHCLELIIKDVHLASLFFAAAKHLAAGNRQGLAPNRPPEHHRLVDLVVGLRNSLVEHNVSMPSDLEPLARSMDTIEGTSPDRYRYAFQRWTKEQKLKGEGPEMSFPTPQQLPLREFQARLDALMPVADIRAEDSLVFKFYTESTIVLNQGIASGNLTVDPRIFT
jgi:hypothetical protein